MAMGSVSPLLRRGTKAGAQLSSNAAAGAEGDTKKSCSYRSAMQSSFGAETGNKKKKMTGEENKKPQKEVRLDSPTSTDM